ncbi:hypothetical protein J6590_016784 [Homalodisca vitripennis]|nr:hypothetical protein J6590_095159 [Homalodisca vitripennis]KAG8278534.1 hypothetical protein J6590_016784 [Homalodisca vitripennis]
MPDADLKLLHVYFMGDESNKIIQAVYKAIEKMDERENKVLYGDHAGTYNVPTINEVAVVMADASMDAEIFA